MSERLAALLFTLALIVTPAAGGSAAEVRILDLPFKALEIRGPETEVALAIATSGVMPIARPKPASADPKAAPVEDAPIAVVWGEGGGAALSLGGRGLTTTLLGAETVMGFAEAEQPVVAVPGSRRAVSGPVTAYFTGPIGSAGRAAGLTIRERQPLGLTSEPKAVPIVTSTVAAGEGMAFVADKPVLATIEGRSIVLAATSGSSDASSLAVVSKSVDAWRIDALSTSKPATGAESQPLAVAAVANFLGTGRPQIAVTRSGADAATIELWTFVDGTLTLTADAPASTVPAQHGRPVLAAVLASDGVGPAELVVASPDRSAIVMLSFNNGVRERARIALPASAATGLIVLGRGSQAHILVGLTDGRVADIVPGRERRQERP